MKYLVAELEGGPLDAAVMLAEFMDQGFQEPAAQECVAEQMRFGSVYRYSRDWSRGGPIFEREGMVAMYGNDSVGVSIQDSHLPPQWGPSLLVAAMRAYVASQFGEVVELPD